MSTTALNRNGSPYIDRACPPYGCGLQYGHGWDSTTLDGTESCRGHGLDIGKGVSLFAYERVCTVDESLPSTTESPTISLYGDSLERQDMTAEQARQHAAVVRQSADDLLKAADMLDQIEGVSA
jgi:hypothetical protein